MENKVTKNRVHKPQFDRKYITGLLQDMEGMCMLIQSIIESTQFRSSSSENKDKILTKYCVQFTYLAERIDHTLLNLLT